MIQDNNMETNDKGSMGDLHSIQLRSREIDGILNDPSHWFVRAGSFIMLGMVILIMSICLLIRYPDSVEVGVKTVNQDLCTMRVEVPNSNVVSLISIGCQALFEADDMPHTHYGYLEGTVTAVSYKAQEHVFVFTIMFPRKTFKAYFKKIQKQSFGITNVGGNLILRTRSRSVFERLYSKLRVSIDR